jgi:hypothetical protein
MTTSFSPDKFRTQCELPEVNIQTLENELSLVAKTLPSFELRKCEEALQKLKTKRRAAKSKFTFTPSTSTISNHPTTTSDNITKPITPELSIYTFQHNKTRDHNNVMIPETKLHNQIIQLDSNINEIQHLIDCQVLVLPPTRERFVCNDVTNCQIFLMASINTSIRLSSITNSEIHIMSAQQIRCHDVTNSTLFVNSNTAPIIERCHHIKFGRPRVTLLFDEPHPIIIEHNNIEKFQVNDFDWLRPNEPSPNWTFVDDDNILPIQFDDTFKEFIRIL